MALQNQPETKTCGRCGGKFPCHAKTGGCWCEKLPALPKSIPDCDCLCPACLEKELKAQGTERP
ncbi:MAG TPA: cysteine-rich CWC family protein [bacterium]|nr:cysteine-rich CWC family protein [bacterium]